MASDPANFDSFSASPAPAQERSHAEGPAAEYYATVRELFREHNRALVGFLLTRLRSEQEALDVAQESYVKLLQLDSPGTIGFLRGYLFRIAANLSIDRARSRQVREKASAVVFDDFDRASAALDLEAISREEFDLVCAALNDLTAKHRHAFVRHVIEGHSTSEVSRDMGVDERTVRKYVSRGLLHCRERLQAHRGE